MLPYAALIFIRSKEEEATISPIQPGETVTKFEPLQDEVYTQELNLENSEQFDVTYIFHLLSWGDCAFLYHYYTSASKMKGIRPHCVHTMFLQQGRNYLLHFAHSTSY